MVVTRAHKETNKLEQRISLDEAASAMRHALHDTVRKNWLLFLFQAALMIGAGLLALIYPLFSSFALAKFLGWVLVVMGIAQVISLIKSTKVPHFWLQLVSSALAIIVGYLFIRNPGTGVGTLALLMIVFFMVEGMSKIVFSLSVRPLKNWGWVLASGVLGVIFALYLMSNPALTLVLLGVFIGIQLISEGFAIGWMALSSRKV